MAAPAQGGRAVGISELDWPRFLTASDAPAQPRSTFDADRRAMLVSFSALRPGVDRKTLCLEIEGTARAMVALLDLQATAP